LLRCGSSGKRTPVLRNSKFARVKPLTYTGCSLRASAKRRPRGARGMSATIAAMRYRRTVLTFTMPTTSLELGLDHEPAEPEDPPVHNREDKPYHEEDRDVGCGVAEVHGDHVLPEGEVVRPEDRYLCCEVAGSPVEGEQDVLEGCEEGQGVVGDEEGDVPLDHRQYDPGDYG